MSHFLFFLTLDFFINYILEIFKVYDLIFFFDFQAFDALEEAIRIVDHEVEKVKDKVRRDTENNQDSLEYIKVSFFELITNTLFCFQSQKVLEINEKIGKALAQVESFGREAKIQESIEASKLVEEYKKKKLELEEEIRTTAPIQQRLRVCETCGAQLNVLDHESRLADHYGGKMHLGMVDIREKYNALKVDFIRTISLINICDFLRKRLTNVELNYVVCGKKSVTIGTRNATENAHVLDRVPRRKAPDRIAIDHVRRRRGKRVCRVDIGIQVEIGRTFFGLALNPKK